MDEQEDDLQAAAAAWTNECPEYANILEGYSANLALLTALAERQAMLGISQRHLAERMGTSQSAVNRIGVGETDPRLSIMQRLAAGLGVTIRWELTLLASSQPPAPSTNAWTCMGSSELMRISRAPSTQTNAARQARSPFALSLVP